MARKYEGKLPMLGKRRSSAVRRRWASDVAPPLRSLVWMLAASSGCSASAPEASPPEPVPIHDIALADSHDASEAEAEPAKASGPTPDTKPTPDPAPPSPAVVLEGAAPVSKDGPDARLLERAQSLLDAGNPEAARKELLRLVQDHPNSPWVPHAYVLFGEQLFQDGELESARALYEKAVSFGPSAVRAYALYKLGWVDFNLGDAANALMRLDQLLRDPDLAPALREEALKDLTLFYSHAGDPTKAEVFFKRYAQDADEAHAMKARLAQHYDDQGKSAEKKALLTP